MTPIERKARELLPCPWCSGEAETERGINNIGYYVSCKNSKCGIGPSSESEDAAEDAWNHRETTDCRAHECRRVRTEMQAEIDRLREGACVALVSEIRFAIGDNGKRMQPELVEYVRGLAQDAARYRFIRDASEDGDPSLRRWTECYEAIGGCETAEHIDRMIDAAIAAGRTE